ncbi:ABC transporter ATP-binding protein [Actinomadura sp. 1N219]|uniref:ABC transporter ATP-binding protein n=1 Tax=Actinomadura sp. 1N219 TaxID=3375152 RepID=UPI0037AD7668
MPTVSGGPVLEIENLRYAVGDRQILGTSTSTSTGTDDGTGAGGIDLSVSAGESVAVTGPSGSGKSTLLMCVLGLVKADTGTIRVAGDDITRMTSRRLADVRRTRMGVVFQFGELLPELSPVENVALPALLAGTHRRQAYTRAQELLGELGVPAAETPTGLLSGGERQRTAVARALITEPALLLADEPTGALDHHARERVADLLFEVPPVHGCALVVVTHDLAVAGRATRGLRLDAGELAEAAL